MMQNKYTLEELLRFQLLESDLSHPKNEMLMNALANSVISPVVPQATPLLKHLLKKYGLYLSALVISLATLIVLQFSSSKETDRKTTIETQTETVAENIFEREQAQLAMVDERREQNTIEKVEPIEPTQLETLQNTANDIQPYSTSMIPLTPKNEIYHSNYNYIPVLTPEEKRENEDYKKKMLVQLKKLDKKVYAKIPSGTLDNQLLSEFYLSTGEISNLQYRTFLFDLLIQDRKEEFLIAKPNQEMWIERFKWSFNQPMKENYFSHPAYNNYPVVNITKTGAEMYCKWLNEEYNNWAKEKNKTELQISLPTQQEWIYAAQGGNKTAKYANGLSTYQNEKGCYLANFSTCPFENGKYDSLKQLYLPADENYKLADDGGFHTVYIYSYNPNAYGLFCMAGNVSEMVYDKHRNVRSIGGSWMSLDKFLELLAPEELPLENQGPSPMLGFRTAIRIK